MTTTMMISRRGWKLSMMLFLIVVAVTLLCQQQHPNYYNGWPASVVYVASQLVVTANTDDATDNDNNDDTTTTTTTTNTMTDTTTTKTKLAFGSCHKNHKATFPTTIWDTIVSSEESSTQKLDAWIWLGDAYYPSHRDPLTGQKRYGMAPPNDIRQGLYNLKYHNATIGYRDFVKPSPSSPPGNQNERVILGVWDDHDFGGNDMGHSMIQQDERKQLFLDFLGYTNNNNNNIDSDKKDKNDNNGSDDDGNNDSVVIMDPGLVSRAGLYHSVQIQKKKKKHLQGTGSVVGGTIKVLVLDTRSFRQDHCIPSVAPWVPMGNAVACLTRWLTAGLFLSRFAWLWNHDRCEYNTLLGDDQWTWLEHELNDGYVGDDDNDENDSDDNGSDTVRGGVDLYVILSSIQVWSTNPATEGWGQFPHEQERLWNLLWMHYNNDNNDNNNNKSNTNDNNATAPVIFLSGDVHHAEISGQDGWLEVTSSGLTHHCAEPKLYGRLCQPILQHFSQHRHSDGDYYIGLNYGVLEVDWEQRNVLLQIKNATGQAVLQVEQSLMGPIPTLPLYKDLPHTWDGHLIPIVRRLVWTGLIALVLATRLLKLI